MLQSAGSKNGANKMNDVTTEKQLYYAQGEVDHLNEMSIFLSNSICLDSNIPSESKEFIYSRINSLQESINRLNCIINAN